MATTTEPNPTLDNPTLDPDEQKTAADTDRLIESPIPPARSSSSGRPAT